MLYIDVIDSPLCHRIFYDFLRLTHHLLTVSQAFIFQLVFAKFFLHSASLPSLFSISNVYSFKWNSVLWIHFSVFVLESKLLENVIVTINVIPHLWRKFPVTGINSTIHGIAFKWSPYQKCFMYSHTLLCCATVSTSINFFIRHIHLSLWMFDIFTFTFYYQKNKEKGEAEPNRNNSTQNTMHKYLRCRRE